MSYSALKIRDSVNKGKSSREEHFQDCLASIRKNKDLGAWIWTYKDLEDSEKTRPRIEHSDYSVLNGVPIGVKDIFNTNDGTTEMGSDLWKGFIAGNDARIVSNFNEAGASIIGKTKTAEFAVHALPDVINPWDKDLNPGTSSTGSAVSVLTGDVPISLGTQTAGSISRPASFCGVIGVKPTFGIFPRTGVLKTCDPFDTVGYFCSHYEDIALIFDSVRLKGANYPLIEEGLKKSAAIEPNDKIRVARAITDSHTLEDSTITTQFESFCDSLPKNYHVEPFDVRKSLLSAREVQEEIYHKSLSYYFSEERKKGTNYSEIMQEIFNEGDKISSEKFIRRLNQLEEIRNDISIKLSDYDLILSPTTSTYALPRTQKEVIDSSLYWTMLHLPLISLPVFNDPESGLPAGLQVVGSKQYSEPLLFKFIRDLGLVSSQIQRPPEG